jgi:putative ABC transport system permease protein
MIHLALKMLVGDRAKFIMLLGGLFFAALLMTQQCAIFFGLLSWTTSHLSNIRAKVWVVEAKVEQVNELKPLRDTDVSRVRSVPGVAWAVPLYAGVLQARLSDGNFKPILCIGLDSTSLVGRPATILSGNLEDIRLPNSVIIDDLALQRLKAPNGPPPKVGDTFEINDREARIVAVCKSDRAFFGYPYVFTTYDQALQFAPRQRKMLSAVLVEPAAGLTSQETADRINASVTGVRAWPEDKFFWDTIRWYFKNTGIPISFGTTILLGFIVGIAISGQTFYGFVLENLKNLGALKAMGASDFKLASMLVTQVMTVGILGYGLGMGAAASFGAMAAQRGNPPFLLPWELIVGVFGLILLICLAAASLAIIKVSRLEPAIVFRG